MVAASLRKSISAIWLPAMHPARLASRVMLGIRPEYLFLDPPLDQPRLLATIGAIEASGRRDLVEFSLGDCRGIAKMGRNIKLIAGTQTTVALPAIAFSASMWNRGVV